MDQDENIIYVCDHCHDEMKQDIDPTKIYINGYVKKCFPFETKELKCNEWMWLKIISVDHKNKILTGILANHPRHATYARFGKKYKVEFDEIYQYIQPV